MKYLISFYISNLFNKNIKINILKNTATPALIRMKKTKQEFTIHSPSDALMSPCTQKLNAPQPKVRGVSQPQNLLRNKQHKDLTEKYNDVLNKNHEDKNLE